MRFRSRAAPITKVIRSELFRNLGRSYSVGVIHASLGSSTIRGEGTFDPRHSSGRFALVCFWVWGRTARAGRRGSTQTQLRVANRASRGSTQSQLRVANPASRGKPSLGGAFPVGGARRNPSIAWPEDILSRLPRRSRRVGGAPTARRRWPVSEMGRQSASPSSFWDGEDVSHLIGAWPRLSSARRSFALTEFRLITRA